MFDRRRILPALVAPVLMLGLLASAAAAAVKFDCSPTKVKGLASVKPASNNTVTFKAIPEAAVAFTQGGTKASCVIVRFSAETFAPANTIAVRATLDGAAAAPDTVQYSGSDGAHFSAHAYDFVFPSVAPGKHTVRMEFQSSSSGGVNVNNHTTAVHYGP